MDVFMDAANADVTAVITRKPRAKPGKYTIRVMLFAHVPERKGDQSILMEYEVLRSSNPATPVGQMCAWFQRLTGKSKDVGPGIFKRLVAVCSGLDPDDKATNEQITPVELRATVSEEQPFAGLILDMEAVAGKNVDDNGDPWCNYIFSNPREEE